MQDYYLCIIAFFFKKWHTNFIKVVTRNSIDSTSRNYVLKFFWNDFFFLTSPLLTFVFSYFFILLNFAENNTLLNLWNFIFVQFCHIYLTQRYPHFFNFFHLQCSFLLTIGSPSNFIFITYLSLVFIPSYCLFTLFIRFCIRFLIDFRCFIQLRSQIRGQRVS